MRTPTAWALTALLLLVGCDSEDPSSPAPAQHYAQPEARSLLVHAKADGPNVMRATVAATMEARRSEPAGKAFWAAIAKADTRALLELYAVEYYGTAEPTYEAVALVQTQTSCACIYANSELHADRPDPETVPFVPVGQADIARAREEIRPHLSMQDLVSLESPVADGQIVVLHVLAGGKSHTALRYQPAQEWNRTREGLHSYRTAYPFVSIVRAIWARAPIAFFPADSESDEPYAALPGY